MSFTTCEAERKASQKKKAIQGTEKKKAVKEEKESTKEKSPAPCTYI